MRLTLGICHNGCVPIHWSIERRMCRVNSTINYRNPDPFPCAVSARLFPGNIVNWVDPFDAMKLFPNKLIAPCWRCLLHRLFLLYAFLALFQGYGSLASLPECRSAPGGH